jgi:hypothetical protein
MKVEMWDGECVIVVGFGVDICTSFALFHLLMLVYSANRVFMSIQSIFLRVD